MKKRKLTWGDLRQNEYFSKIKGRGSMTKEEVLLAIIDMKRQDDEKYREGSIVSGQPYVLGNKQTGVSTTANKPSKKNLLMNRALLNLNDWFMKPVKGDHQESFWISFDNGEPFNILLMKDRRYIVFFNNITGRIQLKRSKSNIYRFLKTIGELYKKFNGMAPLRLKLGDLSEQDKSVITNIGNAEPLNFTL